MRVLFSFFGVLFTALTLGLLCVVMSIGAVFLFYGRDLPSHQSLALYAPPTISRIFDGNGYILDEFAKERRLYTPIEDIPLMVRHAFVAAEDQNFYLHQGYDARGMISALKDAVLSRGRNVRGASTITQQVMKNFLLSDERTGERKIKEIILATRLEKTLSKDKILELYLNEIFLGQNSYGVTAAAQTYFNKTLDALSIQEVAVLAALPTQPSNFHPVRGREKLLARRNYVLVRMAEDGYVTNKERDGALRAQLLSVQAGHYPSFRQSLPLRGYFTDEIRRQLSGVFGEDEFFSGGLAIRATVDPELQVQAGLALRSGLEAYDRAHRRWRGTGAIIALDTLKEDWRAALGAVQAPRDIKEWHLAVVLKITPKKTVIGVENINEDAEQIIPLSEMQWARKVLPNRVLGPVIKAPKDLLSVGEVVYVKEVTDKAGAFSHWSLHQVPELEGAFMAMDVNTGRVLAMQGGFSYQTSVFNRSTQAERQPGSSFKPFVYAAALDSGFTPSTVVVDAPIEVNTPEGLWSPKNSSDKYYGPTP
ncbi:MAG: penicillin-binding protein 1A, partial [Paracoccaceae bacterium]